MLIPIVDTANLGMVVDTPSSEAPINAWSYLLNLSPRDGALVPALGSSEVITTTEMPQFMLSVTTLTTRYILVAGATTVEIYTTGTSFDITPAAALAGSANSWTGGLLGQVPFMNDGTAAPRMWSPQSTGQVILPLSNWPAGWTCGAMRSFQNYLIALDVTKSGTRYGQLVCWSHPADPGATPISWDETNPTYDAGSYPLLDTDGMIVDGLEMRGAFIIGKEDSIWVMRYIGGVLIFSFSKLLSETGLIARNCMTNISARADKQIIWCKDDIILHNGTDGDSILSKRLRRWFFKQINSAAVSKCFVTKVLIANEVWFCYPAAGQTVPNMALVWNWSTNTFSLREIPASNCSIISQFETTSAGGETWNSDTVTWDDDTSTWDQREYNSTAFQCLLGGADSIIRLVDGAGGWFKTPYTFSAERQSMPVAGSASTGKPVVDTASVKGVVEVWPRVTLPEGGTLQVEVGTQMSWSDPITWAPAVTFDPAISPKVNVRAFGRLLSVRLSGTTRGATAIMGFDLDIRPTSRY